MFRTEPLNDFDERAVSAAEADLERLLSIEPSPEFAAKVRARVAEETASRTRGWGWLGLLGTVAAALIVIVILRSGFQTEGGQRPRSTPPHADIVLKLPESNPPNPIVQHVPVADIRPQIDRAPEAPQKAEIIIDHAVVDAIRRLAIAARNTTLDASKGESIAAPNAESDALPVAEPLNVPELVLGPADLSGGQ
jgi:hypothetical protein